MATDPPAPGADGGLVSQARRFLGAAVHFLSIRLKLAALEGKEAAAQVLKLVVMAVAAVVAITIGWLFVCVGMVFLLAPALGERGMMWAALIVAGAHFLAAALLGLAVKSGRHLVLFPLTTEELKKDQAWAQTQKKPL